MTRVASRTAQVWRLLGIIAAAALVTDTRAVADGPDPRKLSDLEHHADAQRANAPAWFARFAEYPSGPGGGDETVVTIDNTGQVTVTKGRFRVAASHEELLRDSVYAACLGVTRAAWDTTRLRGYCDDCGGVILTFSDGTTHTAEWAAMRGAGLDVPPDFAEPVRLMSRAASLASRGQSPDALRDFPLLTPELLRPLPSDSTYVVVIAAIDSTGHAAHAIVQKPSTPERDSRALAQVAKTRWAAVVCEMKPCSVWVHLNVPIRASGAK